MRHKCLMTHSLRLSTRDAIIEAAFTVLSKNPSASLSDVATLAGVGRATLHRHFSSRKDLITDLAKIAMKEMDDAVETACANARTYSEVAEISLRVLIPLGNRYSFLELEDLNEDADLKRQIDEQQDETTDMINRAKREGLFDKSVPTAWIVQAYDHLLYAGWESVKAGETTPDQAADLAWRTLINGLGKPQK